MRSFASALITIPLFVACGDDEVKPGSLNVQWTHPSTATCESRHVVSIEARAIRGGEVVAEGSSSCPAAERSGTIPLSNLDPGTYRIEVEGFDTNDKGTYLGVKERQSVSEGKATDVDVITLNQKPIFLNVKWTLPGGSLCAGSGIEEVEVELIYDAGGAADVVDTQRVACDASVEDPRDTTKTLAGVVFTDLDPDDDVSIVATGYNEDDDAVAKKQIGDLVFSAGDELTQTLALEACPGTPPVCD